MSKICDLTGKKPLVGNNVSHSKRRTRRVFNPNLQTKRFYITELDKWVTLKVATKALRTIDKIGIYQFIKRQLEKGFDPKVWVENDAKTNVSNEERGYRRVEVIGKDGSKSYKITFEPEGQTNKKVKLSSIFK
jgi:large subunit ribosomal protein L28